MPRYICTKWWPRNEVGDIIEHYVWKRLDPVIQKHYFTEYLESSKNKVAPKPVIEPVIEIESVKEEPQQTKPLESIEPKEIKAEVNYSKKKRTRRNKKIGD